MTSDSSEDVSTLINNVNKKIFQLLYYKILREFYTYVNFTLYYLKITSNCADIGLVERLEMTVNFSAQQLKAIDDYRNSKNLGYIISDEAVVNQMIKDGKLPECFSSVAQKTNPQKPTNATKTTQKRQKNNTSIFPEKPKEQSYSTGFTTQEFKPTLPKQLTPEEKQRIKEQQQNNELVALGLQNRKNAGNTITTSDGKTYTIIGEGLNSNKIVEAQNGEIKVLSNSNQELDKLEIITSNLADSIRANPEIARDVTVKILEAQYTNAKKSFEAQLAKDGWAGDLADGISILWGSENRASKVREDLTNYEKQLESLKSAAQRGHNEFNAEFKKIYGENFNTNNLANYIKDATDENYQKTFGYKNNISTRIAKYNASQDTGAELIKGGAKIFTGLAIGVATGGTGLIAVGIGAASTMTASAIIDTSDKLTSDIGIKDGDMSGILSNAVWEGATILPAATLAKTTGTVIKGSAKMANIARAATNTTGDIALGAIQEYAQTGEVSLTGTAINAGLGSIGIAAETGAFKKAKNLLSEHLPNGGQNINTQTFDESGIPLAGGLFGKSDSKGSFMDRLFNRTTSLDTPSTNSKTHIEASDVDIQQRIQTDKTKARKEYSNSEISTSKALQEATNTPLRIIPEFDDNFNLKDISKHVKDGDVCTVRTGKNQKLYVNQNGTAVELKMSKEKFEELFPPKGMALIQQQHNANNCWLVSRINSMSTSSYGRAQLYSMVEETSTGDIIIHLNNRKDSVTFPNGKPIKMNTGDLGKNAAPGIEMIHQASQVSRLRAAEKYTSNNNFNTISDLSIESLEEQVKTMRSDYEATSMLLGTKKYNGTTGANIIPQLENFSAGQDMGVLTYNLHARTIVNYNPKQRTLTYHDQIFPGIDFTDNIDNLINQGAHVSIIKAPKAQPPSLETTSPTKPTQQTPQAKIEQQHTPNQSPPTTIHNTPEPKVQPEISTPINTSKKLNIPEGYTECRIGGNKAITGPNKELFIESDGEWIPMNAKARAVDINNIQAQSTTQQQTIGNPTPKPKPLAIPAGYKEYGKVMGSRAIIGPDNIVMREYKGTWKRVN